MAGINATDGEAAKPSVYLSYHSKAEQSVAPIRDGLIRAGFCVFSTSPPPGAVWSRWVRSQVNKADVVVVLLTGEYFSGDGVLLELAEALDSGKRILPVILESGAEIPAVVRGYRAVNLVGRADRDRYLGPLLEALSVDEPPVDRVSEIGEVEAQERLLRRETEEQARSIEQIEIEDRDKLVDASLTTAGFASGTTVGIAIAGPVGGLLGGVIGVAVSRYLASKKSRRPKSQSSPDSPAPSGVSHDA
ncbi:toll/interleukin-1 receptor domain-containing protein [Streptomyces chartreusis]|uniref:toll/interleukin-1 receptor domain-containing protein n=1 Tax=Streptomyces chartreusis TaxID=1969 RepID=UPI0038038645